MTHYNAAGIPAIKGSGGIQISSLELARFGLLFLNRGKWNGQQLLSASFVDEATRTQVPVDTPGRSSKRLSGAYGFYWYTNGARCDGKRRWPAAPPGAYAAQGGGGNRLFVIPEWNMVVARLGMGAADPALATPPASDDPEQVEDDFFAKLADALRVAPVEPRELESRRAHANGVEFPKLKPVLVDNNPPKQPYYKLAGDVTGDGKSDIIVAGRTGPIVMYSGPQWNKSLIASDALKGGVNGALAEINGDRRLDIVMGGVVWFENPGTSSGDWNVHRINDQNIHDVEVADLNGNGRHDVVCRDQSAFRGRGNQIFVYHPLAANTWKKECIECSHGEGLKVPDVDADGKSDIVIGAVWYQNDVPKWTQHVFGPDWTEPDTKVEVGDINGDGRADIVLTPAELKGAW